MHYMYSRERFGTELWSGRHDDGEGAGRSQTPVDGVEWKNSEPVERKRLVKAEVSSVYSEFALQQWGCFR